MWRSKLNKNFKFFSVLLVLLVVGAVDGASAPGAWDVSNAPDLFLSRNSWLDGENIFFVTHAGFKWNENRLGADDLNRRVSQARNLNAPIGYLVHALTPDASEGYYLDHEPDFAYLSEGGEFQLKMRPKEVFLAGGAFSLCLGETARDCILETEPRPEALRLNYLADSIYLEPNGHARLEDKILGMSDDVLLKFARGTLFSGTQLGRQNAYQRRAVRLSEYHFIILRNGAVIGTHGSEGRAVELNFITSDWPGSSRVFEGSRNCGNALRLISNSPQRLH